MEIHLDSSAINKIIKEGTLPELIQATEKCGAKIYVASPVIDELLAGEDDDHIRRVAGALLKLMDSGSGFRISPGLEELLHRELQSTLAETPIVTKGLRRVYRNGFVELLRLPRPSGFLTELRQRHQERKGLWEPEDIRMRAAIEERFKYHGMAAQEIGAELKSLTPAKIPDWLLELVVHRLGQRPDIPAAVLRSHQGCYPYVLAWSGLLLIWTTALGVPADHRTKDPVLASMKTDTNDYLDAQIGAEAALAQIFVVEDGTFRNRCELLRNGGCVRFRSMTVEEFVSGASSFDHLALASA